MNGTIVKKQKHLLQTPKQDLHNGLIFPISQGGFFGTRNEDVKVCIGYTPLRKYIPKHKKPMSNINRITCGCETCLSSVLLQSD